MKRYQWLVVGLLWCSWAIAPATWGQQTSSSWGDSKFIAPDLTKKISMDFKEAALSDVLKIFSQQSGMNFITSADLGSKRVTLFFENVSVQEALERILNANGLTYEQQEGSDIFVVKALSAEGQNIITRVYFLKHATVPTSKMNKTVEIKPDKDESGGSDSSSSSSSSSSSNEDTTKTAGIVPAVKGVLSAAGKLVEDPRTNSLVVTDVESQFPVIEETIARLDVPVPEILIEVEMLDVSKGSLDELGVKYGNTPVTFAGAQRSTLYPWNQNQLLDKGFVWPGSIEYVPGLINAEGMTAALQFLRTQKNSKTLARPRILTLNNETAQIQISANEAIGISSQSQSQTATVTASAERVQTGVFLTVTPQANVATGEIIMVLAPKVIEAHQGKTFGSTTFYDPEQRGSRSVLKMKSGETIILGGLLRRSEETVVTKLPVLGDIPLVGAAFRHKNQQIQDRELIIFLTPKIVDDKTMPRRAGAVDKKLTASREQDIPSNRLKQIEKDFSSLEQQRY